MFRRIEEGMTTVTDAFIVKAYIVMALIGGVAIGAVIGLILAGAS